MPEDRARMDLLEIWVRSELAICSAERMKTEGEEERCQALGDVLDRIGILTRATREDLNRPLAIAPQLPRSQPPENNQ